MDNRTEIITEVITDVRTENNVKTGTGKKQIVIYLLTAFATAWIIQAAASYLSDRGNTSAFGLLLSVCMFMPFLAVLIAGIPLKGMGWIPRLKGKIKWVFFALWIPALLNLLGAALYFLIFPEQLDTEFVTMKQTIGDAALAQLEAQGLTVETYTILSSLGALTIGPVLNMFLAVGEETGWRGALYPYLKERFGRTKGRIIGGIIHGAWHWPIMLLAGYEYGKEYIGAPVLGLAVFCLSTVFIGILADRVYEKTGTIWGAALLHGAINAWAVYAYLLKPEYAGRMIFGPSVIGLISMIPMAALAILVCAKDGRKNQAE